MWLDLACTSQPSQQSFHDAAMQGSITSPGACTTRLARTFRSLAEPPEKASSEGNFSFAQVQVLSLRPTSMTNANTQARRGTMLRIVRVLPWECYCGKHEARSELGRCCNCLTCIHLLYRLFRLGAARSSSTPFNSPCQSQGCVLVLLLAERSK